MINNLAERGNTASTSHFVALGDSIRSGIIRDGDRVLFGIVASGLTVGAALYTFDDLPSRLSSSATHPVTARPSADTSPGRHFSRHGLRRVRIEALGTSCPADGEKSDSLGLLVRAAQNCLRASSRSIDDIDLLIYSGVYRSEFIGEPAIATLLAGKLGFRRASDGVEHVFAFDVMNGALGFLNGCFSAAAMLETHRYQRAMVVAAEIENNAAFPSAELRRVRESASAVLLTTGDDGAPGFGGFLFRDFLSHVDSFSAHLAQRNGKTYMSFQQKAGLEDDYLTCIDATFHELLEREGLSAGRLSAVLPPQISPVFVAALRRRLPVSPDAVVDTSLKDQDLFTSSLAFSLQELYRTRPPNRGEVAMVLAVATGIQTGAALYYF